MVVIKGRVNEENIRKVATTIAKELQQKGQKDGL